MFGLFTSRSGDIAFDPAEAVRGAAAGTITLVDIRDPSEIRKTGRAAGALQVPLATLRMKADPASPEQLPEFRAGKPLVLYCASGARSQLAVRMLRQMGHQEAYNMGALDHWQAAGGVIER